MTAPSTPSTYYYGACVDSVSSESDTRNNCSSAVTVTVGAAPAPDLVVDRPTVSESAPDAGASFTLNAAVRNQGNSSSASTTLRYYRSGDSTITTGDTEVGTDFVSRLDAAESGDESVSLTAPSTLGTYYYGACVDSVSSESDTRNNCSSAVTVTVGAAPAPDLVVDRPTVSESAPDAGASFTLNAAVRNQGNGSSAFTTLRYYRSGDSTITTADTEVGTDSVFGLDASESEDELIFLTAPSTLGTYYYGACVDAVSGESDTQNNCSSSVTVTVGAAPAPDLVVDRPTVSESAPDVGERFTLNAAVRNQGNGTSASTTLRYYLSGDSTITTGDTEVGTDYVSRLDASESGDESISLTAPSNPGAYHYGACVDSVSGESDTANNCSGSVVVTVGAAPAPDLIAKSPSVSTSEPVSGTQFTFNLTVRNQGSGQSASTTVRFFRSTTPGVVDNPSADNTQVGASESVEVLNSSDSVPISSNLLAPNTGATYYFGACVRPVTGESNTGNNCTSTIAVTTQVGNRPPQLTGDVDDKVVELGESFTVDLSGLFTDPDGDDITSYGFTYRTRGILSGTVNTKTGILSLTAVAVGETIVAVDARDSNGQGGASEDLFKATVTAAQSATKPGAPTGLTATANGQTEIDLSWSAPSDNGRASVTVYKIEVSTDGSNWGDLVANTGSITTSYAHTGLTAGSTRHYRVSAINSAGTGPASNTSSATTDAATAPSAPTGLTATADGQTEIDLLWNAPSDDGGASVTGYKIEVSTDGSHWSDLQANTGSIGTSYSHTGLNASSTRHYRVSAINSAGTGPASNSANATTDAPEQEQDDTCATGGAVSDAANNPGLVADCDALLAAKDTLRGTAALNWSADTAIASWDAVTVSGTPRRVTELDTVYSAVNGDLTGTIPAELGSLSELTILRLSNNKLTGTVPPELGDLSSLKWLSLWNNGLTGTIPSELGNLTNLTMLRLEWNELTGTIPAQLGNMTNLKSLSLGGNRLTGTIPSELGNLTNLRSLSLGGSNYGENQLTGTIPAELKNLTKLQSFDLWKNRISGTIPAWLGSLTDLRTLNLAGNQFTGTIPTELGNLTKVGQFWLQDNQLTGTIPAELGNLTNATELLLRNNRLSGDIPAELSSLAKLRQLLLANNQLTGCIPEGLRDVRDNDLSRLGLPYCNASTAPGAPTGLTATADGQTQIDLSWTAPSDDGGASISGYRIEVSEDNSAWSDLVADTNSTSTSYAHTGLDAGSTRHYRVSAINSAGTGDPSNVADATTEAASVAKPGAPTGLTATADGQTEIDLSWSAPSDNGGASITGYRIEVSADGSNWSDLVANTNSTATSYSHTGLEAGSTRRYRVSAINSEGTGSVSNVANATTDAPTKPGAPTRLTATANGQTQIDLSWTAPSDDGGADITGYRIEVSTDGSSWSDLVANTNSTATSYSHTGLTENSTRHYRVSAINSVGTGQSSNTDSATTDAAPDTEEDDAVTISLTSCSVDDHIGGDAYRVTLAGTVSATRAVSSVRVLAYVDGSLVGTETVGDMEEGQSEQFSVSGPTTVDSDNPACTVEVMWVQ